MILEGLSVLCHTKRTNTCRLFFYKYFHLYREFNGIQDLITAIISGYGLDDRNSISGRGQGFFFFSPRPGREADHSPPSSAEVKE